jgi:manganese transport protein
MDNRSLSEVNQSVEVPQKGRKWKRILAFFGPAYLVSVGYMDPGNWATDLAGGSKFGYDLIWVLLMSNLMALLLQSFSARLGIVTGLDLAQASRKYYHKWANISLYILAEIAIAACDLAEVVGMAIGLNLLFGFPLLWGVVISLLDTFLLLFLLKKGMRIMEAFIIALICVIGISFVFEMVIVKPIWGEVILGFRPEILRDSKLYIAISIIGATVMPHNLYLHSALVQTRLFKKDKEGIKKAIKYNTIDSAIALNLAFFVNAAILILAATAFHKNAYTEVAEIGDAHQLLKNIFGMWAPAFFAIALIAAGQSSTVTGTLAGQIVMEGYLNLRLRPWLRRIITRSIAIVPAIITIVIAGEQALGSLLVLSQVILSLQLGFAMIPLVQFVSDKSKLGEHAIKPIWSIAGWICTAIIVGLNLKWLSSQTIDFIETNTSPWRFILIPILAAALFLLLYIVFSPMFKKLKEKKEKVPHGDALDLEQIVEKTFRRIAITVDFSSMDKIAIENALSQGGKSATYILIHIVETAGARILGKDIDDLETQKDTENLILYTEKLKNLGYNVQAEIGYGGPIYVIPKIVAKQQVDLLVMGAHGHSGIKDIVLGETVDAVRHRVSIPVLIVR